jgi:hypothetical protein
MASLEEILAKADLNDDIAFEFGGSKFTVGDVRKLRKGLDAETKTAKQKREEAEQLAIQAATLLTQLQEAEAKAKEAAAARKATEGNNGGNANDWRKDPFYAPVAEELARISGTYDTAIKEVRELAGALKKTMDQYSSVYAYERLRAQYDRNADKLKGKGDFRELAKQAVERKLLDDYGLPTLEPLISELTLPERIAAERKAAVDEAKATWEKEQAARSVASQRPGAAARFSVKKDEKPPIAKIEELSSEKIMQGIADDPEFAKQMAGETVQ